jgi:hypothetical protein
LESVNLSSSKLTKIGSYAFQNCSALSSITFPDTLTSIEDYAFQNSFKPINKTIKITIPKNVSSIGKSCFQNTDITNMEINSYNTSLTTISQYAFNICTKLTTIKLSNVTKIDKYAFNGCTSLDINNITWSNVKNIEEESA